MGSVKAIESLPFHESLDRMREAMRKIMADSYMEDSNDARKAASDEIKEILSGEPHH